MNAKHSIITNKLKNMTKIPNEDIFYYLKLISFKQPTIGKF